LAVLCTEVGARLLVLTLIMVSATREGGAREEDEIGQYAYLLRATVGGVCAWPDRKFVIINADCAGGGQTDIWVHINEYVTIPGVWRLADGILMVKWEPRTKYEPGVQPSDSYIHAPRKRRGVTTTGNGRHTTPPNRDTADGSIGVRESPGQRKGSSKRGMVQQRSNTQGDGARVRKDRTLKTTPVRAGVGTASAVRGDGTASPHDAVQAGTEM